MKLSTCGIKTIGFLLRIVLLFQHATAYILTAPKNTVARIGQRVILDCQTNLSTPVRWRFDSPDDASTLIYYNEVITESVRDKYEIETNSGGRYNLVIGMIDLTHAGTYICLPTVYPGEREEDFSAQLTVLVSEPFCYTNASNFSSHGIEGDVIQLSCSVEIAGCWRPVMDWHKSNGENIEGSVLLSETTANVESSLILRLNSSDNNVIYSCNIHFSSNSTCLLKKQTVRATNIPDFLRIWNYTVNVSYAPLNIRIFPSQSAYEIGDSISCLADGNPIPTYEWIEIGNRSRGVIINGPILTVDETMASDEEQIFQCTATNVVDGKMKNISDTVKIIVTENHGRHTVQAYLLSVALPVVCFIVLIAMAVYLLVRFCNKAATEIQDNTERHDYETVSESALQIQQLAVVTNESRDQAETDYGNDNEAYTKLTDKQPVVYTRLLLDVSQNEDYR